MSTGRFKRASVLSTLRDFYEERTPEFVKDPSIVWDEYPGKTEDLPLAIAMGTLGTLGGGVAGLYGGRGLWRMGKGFAGTAPGQKLDALTQALGTRLGKDVDIFDLRPISRKTPTLTGAGLGGSAMYNLGGRLSYEQTHPYQAALTDFTGDDPWE
jgi:hypothetical protein